MRRRAVAFCENDPTAAPSQDQAKAIDRVERLTKSPTQISAGDLTFADTDAS
jgi:hypothetical protein